jgi:hypothetical protein
MAREIAANTLWRPMSEAEIMIRAREAWIEAHRAGPWRARRARAGRYDHRLTSAILALRGTARPMSMVLADRDEATTAIALRVTAGVTIENEEVVANAVLAALRVERSS